MTPFDQWCILVFGSADVMGCSRGEGVGGAHKRPPARGTFFNTGHSSAFLANYEGWR